MFESPSIKLRQDSDDMMVIASEASVKTNSDGKDSRRKDANEEFFMMTLLAYKVSNLETLKFVQVSLSTPLLAYLDRSKKDVQGGLTQEKAFPRVASLDRRAN
jgi:hypothetical protein